MYKRLAVLLIIPLALAVQGQTINLRGKVTGTTGQALSGASVELVKRGLKATTGVDGTYSLTGAVGVFAPASVAAPGIRWDGGMLKIRLDGFATIQVEVYDVQGQLLRAESVTEATAGVYSWDFNSNAPSEKMMIIKVAAGSETKTFRHLPMAGSTPSGSIATGSITGSSSRHGLSKAAADVDTLRVTASGHVAKSVGISAYDAEVNVSLSASTDYWGGLKNPAGKSPGCGKATTITTGSKTITSGGRSREYTIDIPTGYDMNKAYRLFYCSHWIGSTDDQVANGSVNPGGGADNWGYYGLKRMARTANDPAIFIAPQGLNGSWGEVDHALFEDILAHAKANLCVDTTRVFATGFSFGGMITYSLSTAKQKKIRAAVGLGPANYNIWLPTPLPRDPIAWMSTTGMSDTRTPWDGGSNRGAKFIALHRAQDNGCQVPTNNNIPTNTTARSHMCYEFQGCREGYPVKACTFDGGHIAAHADGGTGDHGINSWIPTESWNFFTQF